MRLASWLMARLYPAGPIAVVLVGSTGVTVAVVLRTGQSGLVFPSAIFMLTSAFLTSGAFLVHQRRGLSLGLLVIAIGLSWPARLLGLTGTGIWHDVVVASRTLPTPLIVSLLVLTARDRSIAWFERGVLILAWLLPITLYADYTLRDRSPYEPCLSCVSMGHLARTPTALIAHAHVVVVAVALVVLLVRRWRATGRGGLSPVWALGALLGTLLGAEAVLPYVSASEATDGGRLIFNAAYVALLVVMAVTVAASLIRSWHVTDVARLEALRGAAEAQSTDFRWRLQRDLHDGAQFRLISAVLAVQLARESLRTGARPTAVEQLDLAAQEIQSALEDLRVLSRGRHPSLLQEGLGAALRRLTDAAPLPVKLLNDVRIEPMPDLTATVYFVVAEGLANAVRHSSAESVTVRVTCGRGTLFVAVEDDGNGCLGPAGSGLTGLAERVSLMGGTFKVISRVGEGTTIIGELPCAS